MKIRELHFVILSVVMFATAIGLFVFALFFVNNAGKSSVTTERLYIETVDIGELCGVDVDENGWEKIVIHHSATNEGNAYNFDEYHRKTKKWKHGLAYHFVIGNGTHSKDGEIEIGNRWKKQIHGAHTIKMDINRISIGICLVGNFEEDKKPTYNQFESLVGLVNYLSKRYKISDSNIIQHNQVTKGHTVCPGKNFPYQELLGRLELLQQTKVTVSSQNH